MWCVCVLNELIQQYFLQVPLYANVERFKIPKPQAKVILKLLTCLKGLMVHTHTLSLSLTHTHAIQTRIRMSFNFPKDSKRVLITSLSGICVH